MRIVSLAPSNTEILFALGLGNKIVGNTTFCDYPEEAKRIKKVGGWVDINLAAVKKLKPDLVLTSSIVQQPLILKLEEMKLNIKHLDPVSLNDVLESIVEIGDFVDKVDEASDIVRNMEIAINDTKVKVKVKNAKKKKVYFEQWPQPPTAFGNWVPDLIEVAGGVSFSPKNTRSNPIKPGDVVKFNPDIIITTQYGTKKETILQREGWQKLRAVKDNKIFTVNDSLFSRPGPRLTEGLKILAEIIQPEIFGEYSGEIQNRIDQK